MPLNADVADVMPTDSLVPGVPVIVPDGLQTWCDGVVTVFGVV